MKHNEKVQEALSRYVNYRLRKEGSSSKRQELFQIKKITRDLGTDVAMPSDPATNSALFSLQAGYTIPNNVLQLGFSPGIRSFWNVETGPAWASTLEFARIEASVKKEGVRLQRFKAFGMDTLISGRSFETPLVRYLELGFTDWSDWIDQLQRQYELRMGGGWAVKLLSSVDLGIIPFLGVGYYQNSSNNQFGLELGTRLRGAWTGLWGLRASVTIEHIFVNPGTFSDLAQVDLAIFTGKRWSFGPNLTSFDYNKTALGVVGSIRF